MLLVIDIGNTNIECAALDGRHPIKCWGRRTENCINQSQLKSLLVRCPKKIDGIMISSVVPMLNKDIGRVCKELFDLSPLFASSNNIPMKIKGYNPRQLGPDRLLAALAAFRRFKKALIIVDAGTGITIDAVNSKGEFLGGAIAPGATAMAKALHLSTAKLPLVKFKKVRSPTAHSTKDAIRVGINLGLAGLIDRIVESIAEEMETLPLVVATGGAAQYFKTLCKTIRHVCPNLVLEGLEITWNKLMPLPHSQ